MTPPRHTHPGPAPETSHHQGGGLHREVPLGLKGVGVHSTRRESYLNGGSRADQHCEAQVQAARRRSHRRCLSDAARGGRRQCQDAPQTATSSPAACVGYLQNSAEPGAEQTLTDFQGLAAADQELYLDYLNSPEVFEGLLEEAADAVPLPDEGLSAPATLNSTRTESSHGGDVVVVEKETQATFSPDVPPKGQVGTQALSKGTWETTYTVTQKILGVTITKLSVWVNYYTNGSKVTKVNHADGGKRNFNGAVSISKGVPKAWLSGGTANGEIVWEGSIIYKGFGVSIDKRQRVWANKNGYQGGYLKNI